jgi:hypothetical protein
MPTIKGYRFECERCQSKASIQVFYRKDGQVGYARARHLGADKKFYYHQQSVEYVNRKLADLSAIDHGQVTRSKSIEHTEGKTSQLLELEPSAGFGPATITLPR